MEKHQFINGCTSAKSALQNIMEPVPNKEIQNNGICYCIYSGQNSNIEIKSDEFVGKEDHLTAYAFAIFI